MQPLLGSKLYLIKQCLGQGFDLYYYKHHADQGSLFSESCLPDQSLLNSPHILQAAQKPSGHGNRVAAAEACSGVQVDSGLEA